MKHPNLPRFFQMLPLGALVVCCTLCSSALGQGSYFNIRASYGIFGSTRGLLQGMENSGYDDDSGPGWFGQGRDYPFADKYPSLGLEWGRFSGAHRSFSINVGLQNPGNVNGHDAATTTFLDVRHTEFYLNPKINFHKAGSILGLGPSLLVFTYRSQQGLSRLPTQTKVLPGAHLYADAISQKQKAFKFGVFAALALYPTLTTRAIAAQTLGGPAYQPAKVNPTHIQLGFVLQFGNRAKS